MLRGHLLALLLCVASAPVDAGTLCGHVTDANTGSPIARAGIFLRTPLGAYTGLHAATDASGAYCISNIPAATYDIEVRVDGYQIAYVRGVIVNDPPTNVDIATSPPPLQLASPAPNPTRHRGTVIRWALAESNSVHLRIHDVHGRFVRGWADEVLPAGSHELEWDFRDFLGRNVAPGTYFITLQTPDARVTRRVTRLR